MICIPVNWPKLLTELEKQVPPVVVLTPDPAGFSSSRLTGSPLLTKNQRGRARDFPEDRHRQQPEAGAATGEIDADNGGNGFSCRGHDRGMADHRPAPTDPHDFSRRPLTGAPARLPGDRTGRR